jgi:hypothetical protein
MTVRPKKKIFFLHNFSIHVRLKTYAYIILVK